MTPENTSELLQRLNYNMTTTLLPVTVIIGLEAVIGLVGNVLILIIYIRRYEKSNFRYFVLSMAILDLISCLTTMPGEILSQRNWFIYEYTCICKLKSYFHLFTAWGSASILLLLAFDRHRKICHTLEWQIQQSVALKLCILAIVISACVSIPAAILWGKQTYIYRHEGMQINVSICEKSSEYAESVYPFYYILFVYILPVGLMMLAVTSLNILTGKKLFQICGVKGKSVFLDSNFRLKTFNSEISFRSSHIIVDDQLDCTTRVAIDDLDNHETAIYQSETRSDTTNTTIHAKTPIQERTTLSASVTLAGPSMQNTSGEPEQTRTEHNDTDIEINIDVSEHNVTCRINKECDTDTNYSDVTRLKSQKSNFHFRSSARRHDSSKFIRPFDSIEFRRKRKTVIMLILTSVFVTTMTLYIILALLVAAKEGILKNLSDNQKVVFFFFWRLYFINCVVNPILYGFIDPRFRSGLRRMLRRK